MIELAIRHRDQLRDQWQRSVLDPELRWFHGLGKYHRLEPDLADSTWDQLQMVSVSGSGQVAGWLSATFDRSCECVSSLALLRFPSTPDDLMFARDALDFIRILFTDFGARHLYWNASVENPANTIYERLVANHGARKVGVLSDAYAIASGEISDRVTYQLTRAAFDVGAEA